MDKTILEQYGYAGKAEFPEGTVAGRVTEVRRMLYGVICEKGEVLASASGALVFGAADSSDFPAAGDFVKLRYNPDGDSSITEILPRRSVFSRTDFSGHAAGYVKTVKEQIVAANFDCVFVMSSLNRDFNLSRIARYLTLARKSGAKPVVLLTKSDLCGEVGAKLCEVRAFAPDIDTIALSCYTGDGLGELGRYLSPGKTAVFLGMSGTGKSTLINTLAGRELMSVGEIRKDDSRGRHTTTYRELVMLPSGAMVIDTPGMRELGLWDADEGISASFADIESLAGQCRYSDCRHDSEPGCAVKRALADGTLSAERYAEYKKQTGESAFVKKRSKPMLPKNRS